MVEELSKHPSNIAQSAVQYLNVLEVSKRTKGIHEAVLFFLVESLTYDSSAVIESEEGEYLLSNDWDAYYGGIISNFVDYWLPRKVMDDTLQQKAPGVLRKWLKWCYQNNYFDQERYEEFRDSVPKGKTKEIKRLQKAAELLYRLHTPNPGAWLTGDYKKVTPISQEKEPEDWDEGYMQLVELKRDSAFLENEEGTQFGPVMLSKELLKVLEIGDVLNVTIGKYGGSWRVLESGNVYAEGTIF